MEETDHNVSWCFGRLSLSTVCKPESAVFVAHPATTNLTQKGLKIMSQINGVLIGFVINVNDPEKNGHGSLRYGLTIRRLHQLCDTDLTVKCARSSAG